MSGRGSGYHIVGLVRALVETEGRVLVVQAGEVGEDAVEPAADADEQVEHGAGVLPGDQQEEAGRTTTRLSTE